MRKLFKDVGGRALWSLERIVTRYSLIEDRPLLDPAAFPWARTLEANWRAVRRELEAVLQDHGRIPNFQDISADQVAITRDDKWKTYFLYGFGYKAERNCARCPETTRLIEQIPGMMTAFFSILAPGKHIPEHRGLYKGFVRYHLGLIVPEPRTACRIRVGGETAHWEEGKSLMFDDTYPHEVWNDTDGLRAVLFLDVVRPLRFPGSTINRLVLSAVRWSPYVQEARRNAAQWEKRFAG